MSSFAKIPRILKYFLFISLHNESVKKFAADLQWSYKQSLIHKCLRKFIQLLFLCSFLTFDPFSTKEPIQLHQPLFKICFYVLVNKTDLSNT